jgi:ketosteroid isomerase-like protein
MNAATDARLLEMLDRQDILDCIHRYCRGMDRLDRELLLSCYHPDALDQHGAFTGGPLEFWDFFSDWHATNNLAHHHSVSNHTVELSGTTAHTETYWQFESVNPDGSVSLHGGRYVDRFEKREGQWKIAARACLIEWHGMLGRIDLPAEEAAAYSASGIGRRDRDPPRAAGELTWRTTTGFPHR